MVRITSFMPCSVQVWTTVSSNRRSSDVTDGVPTLLSRFSALDVLDDSRVLEDTTGGLE